MAMAMAMAMTKRTMVCLACLQLLRLILTRTIIVLL
jgi:hypothetical protein